MNYFYKLVILESLLIINNRYLLSNQKITVIEYNEIAFLN